MSKMKCVVISISLISIFLTQYATSSELKIEVVEKSETCVRKSQDGDLLSIHYVGTLASNGEKFDSSFDRNEPFVFQVGRKQVIQGWDQGTLDMCEGEKRKLHIPSHLAYGASGAGDRIPPNSDLFFEIELMKIEEAPAQVNVFKHIDTDQDGQLSREEVEDYLVKQVPPEEGKFDQGTMVEEIFQHEDADKNGFISHEEFSGPKHDEL